MKISQHGIDLIKAFEGCRLSTYLDQAGIMTIGYGDTNDVNPGMHITQEEAERRLSGHLEVLVVNVNHLLHVPVNQNQFDALCSFTYNLGLGALQRSHLLRFVNQTEFKKAADEFLRWNMCAGRVNTGLTRRREAEKALFLS